jgi:cytochrome c biogenesis protein
LVKSQDIIVNDPLHYKGISIFQASYGPLPTRPQDVRIPDELTLAFTSKATGKVYEEKVTIGQTIDLPENLGKFTVNEAKTSYNFRGQDLGATIVGTLLQSNGNAVEVALPVQFPSFDKMGPVFNKSRSDELFIVVSDIRVPPVEQRYFTGLQVSRDPGVWVVYTGFIMIIIGCYVTFFMSHRQVCVDVAESGNNSRVVVTGTANKNKFGNERKLKILAQTLRVQNSET